MTLSCLQKYVLRFEGHCLNSRLLEQTYKTSTEIIPKPELKQAALESRHKTLNSNIRTKCRRCCVQWAAGLFAGWPLCYKARTFTDRRVQFSTVPSGILRGLGKAATSCSVGRSVAPKTPAAPGVSAELCPLVPIMPDSFDFKREIFTFWATETVSHLRCGSKMSHKSSVSFT